ncbi:outer membrane beta-barrel protein [Pseudomarimonas salicorniae]|uniref:Outer membrane beta-barrel protein n=1 Tax=Pseudomarimonas salicorniae TaxID=2933270 RepID=A0ABT0GJD4_9GAMM|nr:outer membrane beta-barrel protein [Lysobacter sp. CAU 1642]MCK7594656.1 outer membrane beta-barrel protein [Lysobacter sp. CAU 1642]
MFTGNKTLAIAAALALGATAPSGAQDLGFTYVEGGIIAGFVNDVENSGTINGAGSALELETDAGGGGFIGGAWQFGERFHLFGDYSSTSQDLEVSDGSSTVEGDFDLVRWRIGVGYAYPISDATRFYGRLSFDNAELDNVKVAGFDLAADLDDDGLGGELGMIWAATPDIQVQGHLRYTSVGEVAGGGSDAFDSDILVGLNGRWFFRPGIALITGYELGKITTWNVGLRFSY